jgi:hypothetical protein
MVSRAVPLVIVLVLCGIVTTSAVARQPPTGTAMYVVRHDPRLCPSPLCGGYWVAIANGARTRCHDGLRRPRCYVATAVAADGGPLAGVGEGALVRGAIDLGSDDLGELVVSAVYAPAGRAPLAGGFYRVVDTEVRCVRAPCRSYRATQLNGRTRATISKVQLDTTKASPAEVARAHRALQTADGRYVRGVFSLTADGGGAFVAVRLYLRAPLPRA